MADLGGEVPLPLGGEFSAGADLWVDLQGGRSRLAQLLGDTGLQGLLTHEQGGLQFLSQQEVMFCLLHLREWETGTSRSLTRDNVPHLHLEKVMD